MLRDTLGLNAASGFTLAVDLAGPKQVGWQVRPRAGAGQRPSGGRLYRLIVLPPRSYFRRLGITNAPISRIRSIELPSILALRLRVIRKLSDSVDVGRQAAKLASYIDVGVASLYRLS